MKKLTLEDKSKILFGRGFIQRHQWNNEEIVERRWTLYKTVPQLTRYDLGAR